jgi:anti-anti-sigma factor
MSLLEAPHWTLDVDRGPEWLFIRLHIPEGDALEENQLAESIWQTMQQHFAKRVVLELNELRMLHSRILGQLVLLHKRIHSQGGVMRVCGLNELNQEVVKVSRLHEHFPNYRNREEAVMGPRPMQPR